MEEESKKFKQTLVHHKRKRALFLIAFSLIIIGATSFGFLLLPTNERTPIFSMVKNGTSSSEILLLDRNGQLINQTRRNFSKRHLGWVSLPDISPDLSRAIIGSEDRNFWSHNGVDWIALAKASLTNSFSKHKRGASTLTMQLSSLLNTSTKAKTRRRNWLEKIQQIKFARALEQSWTKSEILEAYLNLATFRSELVGIGAASRGLFEKSPNGLVDTEAAILSALLKAPGANPEELSHRACRIFRHEFAETSAGGECSLISDIIKSRLALATDFDSSVQLAPHAAQYVIGTARIQGTQQSTLNSTLDREIQKYVSQSLRAQVLALKDRNALDGAAIVIENKSGEILAYVGSVGRESKSPHVDGVRALRQAGSTLKPFLYGMALDKKFLTATSMIEDSPTDLPVFGGVYHPRNYDNKFHGMVPVRVALASSLNVPAVRTLQLVGIGSFLSLLSTLGFEDLKEPEFYGPSLALGSVDISLWDLTNAYRVLANLGTWSNSRLGPSSNEPQAIRSVFSREAAQIVSRILSDSVNRSLTFGLSNSLRTRFWSAVKTGTSKDMRDNWCVGYSEKYTVGVWVGNFNGEPMWNVSGVMGAAPAWTNIMNWLHEGTPSQEQILSDNLVEDLDHNLFIRGTEDSDRINTKIKSEPIAKILYPTDDLQLAIDPDIPLKSQKIFFEANVNGPQWIWILDGKNLNKPANALSKTLIASSVNANFLNTSFGVNKRGQHTLALYNEQSKKIADQVKFLIK